MGHNLLRLSSYFIIIFNNRAMRLDASYLHFMSKEEFRILAAIQMGMRNHEYVPIDLITRIGNLRGGETFKTVQKLLKHKFIVHIGNKCNGYKLTYLGYDYLALNTFIKRGLIKEVLGKIGVGKQSDIYKCTNPDGQLIILKLTRLGRNSFRSIKNNRQYIQHRTNYNWLYLSRLSSIRQFMFMQLLYKQGFPTPKPIDTNRHAILMSLIDGDTLCHIHRMTSQDQIAVLFKKTLDMLVKFAQNGLIHGDYNEFNLMVDSTGTKLTVIDFPQCISVNHPNAASYFYRDLECLYVYFSKLAQKSFQENVNSREEGDMKVEKLLNMNDFPMPTFEEIQKIKRLDHQIKNLGHITLAEYNELQQYRSEEQRMRKEMENYHKDRLKKQGDQDEDSDEEDNEEEVGQEGQEEQISDEEDKAQQFEQLERKNQKEEGKQVVFDEIQLIQKNQEGHKYDEQLQKLIGDIGDNFDIGKQIPNEHDQSSSSSSQEQRFKGLTPYEIRMKIKQQKRIQREKKKQVLSTQQFIKKALKKNNYRRPVAGKGNHGAKNKIKEHNFEIKCSMS